MLADESTNKIMNETSFLQTVKKPQPQSCSGSGQNFFKILNKNKKSSKNSLNYNIKLKLNILENLNEPKFNEGIDTSIPCEVKINDIYEKGYLQLKNYCLLILRNKIEDTQNNYISDLGVEKIIDTKKYNSTVNTDISTEIALSSNKCKSYKENYLLFLDFNLITCKIVVHKTKHKFRLLILGKQSQKNIDKYWIIKIKLLDSEKIVFNNICKNINNKISSSKGYKDNVINTSLNKYFCQDYFIDSNNFFKTAKTCDIILFRSFSLCSQCQRCITKGGYDHIGLLVKISNELFVYETTGKDGVVLRKWYEFIKYYWYLLCEKICFRKLIVTQDAMKKFISNNNTETMPNLGSKKNNSNYTSGFSDSNVEVMSKAEIENQFYYLLRMKIDSFMQKSNGKKYYFSICHYLFKGFYKKKVTPNFKDGYFCSELIAAVYNYCGILSNKLNISNYLPGSFEENGDATFNEGFSLGPEYIIIFS